jgi:hypothetical protein
MNEPMVKLAGLYEKTSQKGNRYFIGRMNGARLLMFQNIDKQQEADPDWILYVQERTEQGKEGKLRTVSKPEAGDFGGIAGGDYPTRRRKVA